MVVEVLFLQVECCAETACPTGLDQSPRETYIPATSVSDEGHDNIHEQRACLKVVGNAVILGPLCS